MSAQIIAFGEVRRTIIHPPPAAAPSTTAESARPREQRRKLWKKAEITTAYWCALVDLMQITSIAQREGVFGSGADSQTSIKAYMSLVESHQGAVSKQLLTPAPTLAALNWKRAQLGKTSLSRETKERVEKAIADDVAFLNAHPTRRERPKQGKD
jgi:hypothetical protein